MCFSKCQEPNHLPLKCEEVEKDDELRARQAIEERMTQALIRYAIFMIFILNLQQIYFRECPKCHNKFVKTDGCNKMTCKCGTKICYICRIPIKDYNHFHQGPPGTNPRKLCPLYSNNDELHVDIVMAEGAKAKEELAQKGVTLKHDPTAVAPVATGGGGAPAAGFHGYMQVANLIHGFHLPQVQVPQPNIPQPIPQPQIHWLQMDQLFGQQHAMLHAQNFQPHVVINQNLQQAQNLQQRVQNLQQRAQMLNNAHGQGLQNGLNAAANGRRPHARRHRQ